MNMFDRFKGEIEKLRLPSKMKAEIVYLASLYLVGRDSSEGTFYTP